MAERDNAQDDVLTKMAIQVKTQNIVISSIKQQMKTIQDQIDTDRGLGKCSELGRQIAEDVTSIVGLKEVITWKSKTLKFIWALALVGGVCATVYFVISSAQEYLQNPIATQVELVAKPSYDYPPIIVCTNPWQDKNKIASYGLSQEALKYSTGFYDTSMMSEFENSSIPRQDFLDFYQKHNFSSLETFYESIAVDIVAARRKSDFERSRNSTFICFGCVDDSKRMLAKKLFFLTGVCYLFELTPENGDSSRSSLDAKTILFKMSDRDRSSFWQIYVTHNGDIGLRYTAASSVVLPPFMWHTVTVAAQRFQKLNSARSLCDERKNSDYSKEKCSIRCKSEIQNDTIGCRWFTEVISNSDRDRPFDYCNCFDQPPLECWERGHSSRVQTESSTVDEVAPCLRGCLPECDKTVYKISLRSQMSVDYLAPIYQKGVKEAIRFNMSVIAITFEHDALFGEGIWTLKEISTISFTGLVSNLGGALGLFVGGTMMTFVQVILFVFKYFQEKGCKIFKYFQCRSCRRDLE